MKRLFYSAMICFLMVSCKVDKNAEKPYDIQSLKQTLEKDSDYGRFVVLDKEIKLMAAEASVDMKALIARMKTLPTYDYCSASPETLEDIRGGVEYGSKACELFTIRTRLFDKYPFLKNLSFEEYQYLLYSDTNISVDPNDLIIKRKQNNEK